MFPTIIIKISNFDTVTLVSEQRVKFLTKNVSVVVN